MPHDDTPKNYKQAISPEQNPTISDYDKNWPQQFEYESSTIQTILGDSCVAIHHIGSTAIPGLKARPIIDLLVTIKQQHPLANCIKQLQQLGYASKKESHTPSHHFLVKSDNQQNYNLYLFNEGHNHIKQLIASRNYLRDHNDTAQAYGAIKSSLAKIFHRQIKAYLKGKKSFLDTLCYWADTANVETLNAEDVIQLETYDPKWPRYAAAEIDTIQNWIHSPYDSIHHLGSTAIPGMNAKPVIDLFIGLDDMRAAHEWIKPLQLLGYIYWQDNPNPHHARYYKGMPPYGSARTHHLHILPAGPELDKRIRFKSKLTNDPELQKAYQQLKKDLSQQHRNDREAYTEAKSQFIKKHSAS